jgi:hypothetical protein
MILTAPIIRASFAAERRPDAENRSDRAIPSPYESMVLTVGIRRIAYKVLQANLAPANAHRWIQIRPETLIAAYIEVPGGSEIPYAITLRLV